MYYKWAATIASWSRWAAFTARDNAKVSCLSVWTIGKSAASATLDNTDCASGNIDLKVVSRCSSCPRERQGDTCDDWFGWHGDWSTDACVNDRFCGVSGDRFCFMGDDNGVVTPSSLPCPCVGDCDDGALLFCDSNRKLEMEHWLSSKEEQGATFSSFCFDFFGDFETVGLFSTRFFAARVLFSTRRPLFGKKIPSGFTNCVPFFCALFIMVLTRRYTLYLRKKTGRCHNS